MRQSRLITAAPILDRTLTRTRRFIRARRKPVSAVLILLYAAGLARAADSQDSCSVTVQDIFDFLSCYFGHCPAADFNHSGAQSVQDIFDSLHADFAGCS